MITQLLPFDWTVMLSKFARLTSPIPFIVSPDAATTIALYDEECWYVSIRIIVYRLDVYVEAFGRVRVTLPE